MTDRRCKCGLRTSLVGDGCRYCNPLFWLEHLEDEVAALRERLAKLELAYADAIVLLNDLSTMPDGSLPPSIADNANALRAALEDDKD